MDQRMAIPILAAFAVVVHLVELTIPSPVPFFRPGLANIVALIGIVFLGITAGLYITWIRVIVGSLFAGSFLSPAFLLSFSGGTAATLAMGLCVVYGKNKFSLIGTCLVGATVHLLTQFLVAYVLFLGNGLFLFLVPVLLLCALVSGSLTGVVSHLLVEKIKHTGIFQPALVHG